MYQRPLEPSLVVVVQGVVVTKLLMSTARGYLEIKIASLVKGVKNAERIFHTQSQSASALF